MSRWCPSFDDVTATDEVLATVATLDGNFAPWNAGPALPEPRSDAAVGVYLGRGIATFIDIFNPEKVILAGGASRARRKARGSLELTVPKVALGSDGMPSPESFARTSDVRLSRRELLKVAEQRLRRGTVGVRQAHAQLLPFR